MGRAIEGIPLFAYAKGEEGVHALQTFPRLRFCARSQDDLRIRVRPAKTRLVWSLGGCPPDPAIVAEIPAALVIGLRTIGDVKKIPPLFFFIVNRHRRQIGRASCRERVEI